MKQFGIQLNNYHKNFDKIKLFEWLLIICNNWILSKWLWKLYLIIISIKKNCFLYFIDFLYFLLILFIFHWFCLLYLFSLFSSILIDCKDSHILLRQFPKQKGTSWSIKLTHWNENSCHRSHLWENYFSLFLLFSFFSLIFFILIDFH